MKINSAEENEFVLNLFNMRAPSLKQVSIGIKWNPGVKDFLWYDHSVPIYKNWNPNKPNGKASVPCGHMFTRRAGLSGYWNDKNEGRLTGVHHGFPCDLACKRLPSLTSQQHPRSKPKVERFANGLLWFITID